MRLAGTVRFDACFAYTSRDEWLKDEERHRVAADSPYAMEEGGAIVYGWVVAEARRAVVNVEEDAAEESAPPMRRVMRSLFQLMS